MNKNDIYSKLKAIAAGDEMAQTLPAIWKHEVRRPLIGQIKGFGSFHHDRYGMQKTVIVEQESGELVSAILNDYLENGMQRQQAEVGDFVLIVLLGKEYSNNGNAFNKYNLVVQKAF